MFNPRTPRTRPVLTVTYRAQDSSVIDWLSSNGGHFCYRRDRGAVGEDMGWCPIRNSWKYQWHSLDNNTPEAAEELVSALVAIEKL